ncbi:MAG: suppressor of fused domain protein [Promicromonosporaceae bacterium]|nr:suppressor of fused domain protein [Promicromonosporaceae bacterium]
MEDHVRAFFVGRRIDRVEWTGGGPIGERNPHFHVLRVAPGNGDDLWTYVSIGNWAWESDGGRGLEFVLATATPTERAVELLAWNSWYDRTGTLGLGHTVPIGEPWLPGSACDHWLISPPYPWGPELEVAHIEGTHVDFLWLVPITASERDFKAEHGQEQLEQRFEAAAIRFWDPQRVTVA